MTKDFGASQDNDVKDKHEGWHSLRAACDNIPVTLALSVQLERSRSLGDVLPVLSGLRGTLVLQNLPRISAHLSVACDVSVSTHDSMVGN